MPDDYAQTNQIEVHYFLFMSMQSFSFLDSNLLSQNVAQNTVVSVYDKVVPGGFGSAQPNWNNIFHQYATLQWKAGNQIIPGGTCDRHLINSETVSTGTSAAGAMAVSVTSVDKPDSSFKGNYSNIVTDFPDFTTKDTCYF